MNLVACGEDCEYQQEGICKLNSYTALINSVPINGCSYYSKKQRKRQEENKEDKQ